MRLVHDLARLHGAELVEAVAAVGVYTLLLLRAAVLWRCGYGAWRRRRNAYLRWLGRGAIPPFPSPAICPVEGYLPDAAPPCTPFSVAKRRVLGESGYEPLLPRWVDVTDGVRDVTFNSDGSTTVSGSLAVLPPARVDEIFAAGRRRFRVEAAS